MVTAEEIRELPTDEKLRMMELLWSDLTGSTDELDSPSWHKNVLAATTKRVAEGVETPIDFADAKKLLRSERG